MKKRRKYWTTFKWQSRIPSWTILAALRNPRANESIAPICAMKRSFGSVDSRRTLASKFNPPGCSPFYFIKHIKPFHYCYFWKPPCNRTFTCRMTCCITAVQALISIGNWSVSQPRSGLPVFASILPNIPKLRSKKTKWKRLVDAIT